jgi:hypothetical protein
VPVVVVVVVLVLSLLLFLQASIRGMTAVRPIRLTVFFKKSFLSMLVDFSERNFYGIRWFYAESCVEKAAGRSLTDLLR